ncbi:hypothetical protein QOZ80_7BG0588570 [Eleusine coracana subsp. coracana]|nr:hypothetical protein QOZ80_7BG0588570 [Eleusine coracana subsp. coracana]
MIRRFVNLVAANNSSCTYSLHRLDVSKYLFYPSIEEANANENHDRGTPSKVGTVRRLPPVSMRFHRFPQYTDTCLWPKDETFVLLNSHSSEGRILHLTHEGHAFLYDADARSMSAVPSHDGPWGYKPKFISIADDPAGYGKENNSLYLISETFTRVPGQLTCPSFEVLNFNEHPRKWQPLPVPPSGWGYKPSFTVVDGGHTLCVSCSEGTYCFNTRSREWRRAGDWELPFKGRAHYVPELGTWLGFSSRFRGLCSWCDDLSASSDLSHMDTQRAPMLQHVWEDLIPLQEEEKIVLSKQLLSITIDRKKSWVQLNKNLLNLGGGRFCVAKFFQEQQSVTFGNDEYDDTGGVEMASCTRNFIVLTGVEVLRGGDSEEAGLRMVKHRSKRYMFTKDVEIKWVL